jgi:hypothetical protein
MVLIHFLPNEKWQYVSKNAKAKTTERERKDKIL